MQKSTSYRKVDVADSTSIDALNNQIIMPSFVYSSCKLLKKTCTMQIAAAIRGFLPPSVGDVGTIKNCYHLLCLGPFLLLPHCIF